MALRKTNAIQLRTAKEFENLLNSLLNDCAWARTAFRQRLSLHRDLSENLKVFEAAKTFWTLTLYAHDDFVMARLCRIYDQHKNSLNLRRLLLTIQDNPAMFDEAQFRDRNKDDPFVEVMAVNAKRPDEDQLAKDIADTSKTDPLVRKLCTWRNGLFAHTDPRPVLTGGPPITGLPLNQEEVTVLIERANDVLFHRYRQLFKAAICWGYCRGVRDYLPLFKIPSADLK